MSRYSFSDGGGDFLSLSPFFLLSFFPPPLFFFLSFLIYLPRSPPPSFLLPLPPPPFLLKKNSVFKLDIVVVTLFLAPGISNVNTLAGAKFGPG